MVELHWLFPIFLNELLWRTCLAGGALVIEPWYVHSVTGIVKQLSNDVIGQEARDSAPVLARRRLP